jgi:hypothetical protein
MKPILYTGKIEGGLATGETALTIPVLVVGGGANSEPGPEE